MNISKEIGHNAEISSIMSLDTLNKLNIACIFAIRNDKTHKVYVSHTTNLLVALGRIMSDIFNKEYGTLNEEIETSTIDILTTDVTILDNVKLRRLHTSIYTEQYKSNGYTLYKPSRSVKYNVLVTIKSFHRNAYFVVELANARNDRLIMGVFDNKSDADNFTNKYYPNGVVTGFFYDTGSVSKEMIKHF